MAAQKGVPEMGGAGITAGKLQKKSPVTYPSLPLHPNPFSRWGRGRPSRPPA